MTKRAVILSAEHANNHLPQAHQKLVAGNAHLLTTHLAYDIGSKAIAHYLARNLGVILFEGKVTRLLIDLNRSLHHKNIFSFLSQTLAKSQKETLINNYYLPYRGKIEQQIENLIASNYQVLHISVHSFTPILDNKERNNDIGLLYDPKRKEEKRLAIQWKSYLKEHYKVRFNYPYLGINDGLTTFFRKRFKGKQYLGVELELNQKLLINGDNLKLAQTLFESIKQLF